MPQSHLNWSNTLNDCLISQQMNYDPETEDITAHHLSSSLTVDKCYVFDQIW